MKLLRFLAAISVFATLGYSLVAKQSYTPPVFADAERRARLEKILPELDALYRQAAADKHLPGYIWGVVLDGQLIHVDCGGLAVTDSPQRVTRHTRFRIASMTKSFTAMAVLKLRDAGKLSLDDTVGKYVPSFENVARLTSDSPPVTIRHLLRMGAGFPQDDPWGDRRLADTIAEFEQLIGNGLSYSTPTRTGYEYSNLGYALLGRIITQVSGEPYQSYITREILQPLGMTHTSWEFSSVPRDELALGYRWEHDSQVPEPMLHDGVFGAMGGLITTIDDFARYVAFHLDAWPPRDDADTGPVSRATRREMHHVSEFVALLPTNKAGSGAANPRVAAYGYGLSWNTDARGVIWIRHAGGLPGFGSEYRFLPEHGVALIAFANQTYAPMSAINAQAMELLIEKAKLPPRTLPPSSVLQERAAQLATLIRDWDSSAAKDALAANFYLDRSRADWSTESRELLAQLGKVTRTTPVIPLNQLRGTFSLIGERGRIDVYFTLMPEAHPRVQTLSLSFVATDSQTPQSAK